MTGTLRCRSCGHYVQLPAVETPVPVACPSCGKPFPVQAQAELRPRSRWRWLPGIVLIACITLCCGLPIGLTLRTVKVIPPDTSEQDCGSQAEKIVAALLKYEQENGHFPPAHTVDEKGKPMHSWRVLILPQLGYQKLYDQIKLDEPWNSTANAKLEKQMPKEYRCPATISPTSFETNYAVIEGKGFVFDGPNTTKLDSISDSLDDTILIAETLTAINWMEPTDIKPSGIGSYHELGGHVGLASGDVKFILSLMPPEEIHALLTTEGGERVPVW